MSNSPTRAKYRWKIFLFVVYLKGTGRGTGVSPLFITAIRNLPVARGTMEPQVHVHRGGWGDAGAGSLALPIHLSSPVISTPNFKTAIASSRGLWMEVPKKQSKNV